MHGLRASQNVSDAYRKKNPSQISKGLPTCGFLQTVADHFNERETHSACSM
jgi:hypothetical protein